jgi:GAF domain-containing protein
MSNQPPPESDVARELAQRTAAALAEKTLDDALTLVVGLALESGLCDQASVTQRIGDGEFLTTAPSDELVVRADKLQYALGEGPCVHATFADDLLFSADIRTDARWPKWGPAAADLGIAGIISAHLYDAADQTGSLNLYSFDRRHYTDEERDLVRLIATHASIALAHFRGAEHLWKAVDSRHNIGIAQGILMHKYQMNAEAAFALLRRHSQDNNWKIRDIAVHIARTHALPDEPPAPQDEDRV